MAKNSSSVIDTINATGYVGKTTYNGLSYKISGNFNADAVKQLASVTGNIMDGETQIAGFEARRSGTGFAYSFNNVKDVEALPAASSDAQAAVEELQRQLNAMQ